MAKNEKTCSRRKIYRWERMFERRNECPAYSGDDRVPLGRWPYKAVASVVAP
jgi:hypothetical protein